MIIKKWNSTNTSWEEQYPKTLETMIYDSNATTTPIFLNGKLKQAYLPDSVFGGMTLVGAISTTSTPPAPLQLETLIDGTLTSSYSATQLDTYTGKTYTNGDYASIGQRYVGHYWVISSSLGGLSIQDSTSTDEAEWGSAVYDDGQVPSTGGQSITNVLGLENGDWLVITGWDNANSRFLFSVINNSYQAATTSTKGIVELATDAEVTSGTATNLIPSVKQLKDNYAAASHEHDTDEISVANAYANIGSSANDSLTDVLADINSVVAGIATNASGISTNASSISANAQGVSSNATDIASNYSLIQANTTAINGNDSDIATLSGRKTLFVQASSPTANNSNDIWFDI